MTYFQKRRAEILGPRKRRPRRCDLIRQHAKRIALRTAIGRQKRALTALEKNFARLTKIRIG